MDASAASGRMEPVFGGSRLPLDLKELRYSPKVLVGKWFEESTQVVKHNFPQVSTYQNDYVRPNVNPKMVQDNQDIYFDNQTRSMGDPVVLDDLGYATNFATFYDLTYNRAVPELLTDEPKKFNASAGGYQKGKDYTQNYVGGVNKGLLAYKLAEWKRDSNPDDEMFVTITSQDYPPRAPTKRPLYRRDGGKSQPKATNEVVCCCAEHPQVSWVERRQPKKILPSL